jgi:rubrerythrin
MISEDKPNKKIYRCIFNHIIDIGKKPDKCPYCGSNKIFIVKPIITKGK